MHETEKFKDLHHNHTKEYSKLYAVKMLRQVLYNLHTSSAQATYL